MFDPLQATFTPPLKGTQFFPVLDPGHATFAMPGRAAVVCHREKRKAGKRAGAKTVDLTRSLIRSENEKLVFDNRATKRSPELVLLHHRALLSAYLEKSVVRI